MSRPAYPPDLFLFDFDGTLADTLEISSTILNELAAEFRFRPLPPEELEAARRLGTREFIRHLGVRPWRVPGIARRGLLKLQDRISEVMPIAGIPETLAELHARGHRIGILTSNSETNVLAFMARHRLPYFHFVRTSSKLFGKARVMHRILRSEKVSTGKVVYVGDETRDIEAAREAGMRIAAVTWGFNAPETLAALSPDHLLSSPAELLTIGTPGGSPP